jgi:hypothetical protein
MLPEEAVNVMSYKTLDLIQPLFVKTWGQMMREILVADAFKLQ